MRRRRRKKYSNYFQFLVVVVRVVTCLRQCHHSQVSSYRFKKKNLACLGRKKNALITTPAAASPHPTLVPVYSKAGFENYEPLAQSADDKYNNKGMEKETKNDFLMMHKKRPFQMGLSNDFTSDTTHTLVLC